MTWVLAVRNIDLARQRFAHVFRILLPAREIRRMVGHAGPVVVLAFDVIRRVTHRVVPKHGKRACYSMHGSGAPERERMRYRLSSNRCVMPEEKAMRPINPIRRCLALLFAAGIVLPLPFVASHLEASPSDNANDGKSIFRFDTFGDEQLWTDVLRMNE